MKIAAAQTIRPYRAPQWLVEPRPDGICDADDLEVLNTAGVEVLENHDILGWPPYNAIIRYTDGDDSTDYLAHIAD